jgi:TolB protein
MIVSDSIRMQGLPKAVMMLIFVYAFSAGAAGQQDYPLRKVPQLTRLVDYEASWSPDSRRIVLISNRHGGMKVHVMNADSADEGSDMQQISTGPDEDDSPSWSPDGKRIVFVRIHAGQSLIFVMNSDGSAVQQLTTGAGQNIHPVWTPDSSRILFNTTHFAAEQPTDDPGDANRVIGQKGDDSMDLATMRADGSDLRRLTKGGGYTYASYSPDGRWIVHRHQEGKTSTISVMTAEGKDDRNLSGASTLDGWPAWSSDGKRVVFSRNVEGRFQLFVMNRDGTDVRQLTDAPGEFTNARWSPNGLKILCGRRLGGVSLVLFDAPK